MKTLSLITLATIVLSLTSCKPSFTTTYRVNDGHMNYYVNTLDIKNDSIHIKELNRSGKVRVEKTIFLKDTKITKSN